MPDKPPAPPIGLTDEQMSAVLAASCPLPANRRSAFLEHVARELANAPMIGDGMLHRTIMQMQRAYFDAPDLGRGNDYSNIADATRRRPGRASAMTTRRGFNPGRASRCP
jgi:hypothetical protein